MCACVEGSSPAYRWRSPLFLLSLFFGRRTGGEVRSSLVFLRKQMVCSWPGGDVSSPSHAGDFFNYRCSTFNQIKEERRGAKGGLDREEEPTIGLTHWEAARPPALFNTLIYLPGPWTSPGVQKCCLSRFLLPFKLTASSWTVPRIIQQANRNTQSPLLFFFWIQTVVARGTLSPRLCFLLSAPIGCCVFHRLCALSSFLSRRRCRWR